MLLYLDVSCLNRPFDDQAQPRIRFEAEAVMMIIQQAVNRGWDIVSSSVALYEIEELDDHDRRECVLDLLPDEENVVLLQAGSIERGGVLQSMGFAFLDAMHIAAAEQASADVFLTCDDRLLRRANRYRTSLRLRVRNPLEWWKEQAP